jgi:hypothetical protein
MSAFCFLSPVLIFTDVLDRMGYNRVVIISIGAMLLLSVFLIGSVKGENELYQKGHDTIGIEGVDLLGVNIADTFDKGILYTKDGKAYFIMWDKVDSISYDTKMPSRMACHFRMCDRRILSDPN